jgi:hypothetical protein
MVLSGKTVVFGNLKGAFPPLCIYKRTY